MQHTVMCMMLTLIKQPNNATDRDVKWIYALVNDKIGWTKFGKSLLICQTLFAKNTNNSISNFICQTDPFC